MVKRTSMAINNIARVANAMTGQGFFVGNGRGAV
jgi:hypothetical protein